MGLAKFDSAMGGFVFFTWRRFLPALEPRAPCSSFPQFAHASDNLLRAFPSGPRSFLELLWILFRSPLEHPRGIAGHFQSILEIPSAATQDPIWKYSLFNRLRNGSVFLLSTFGGPNGLVFPLSTFGQQFGASWIAFAAMPLGFLFRLQCFSSGQKTVV